MENHIVEENLSIMEANGKSFNDGSLVLSDHAKEKETLDIGLLQDLDSYWEDINGRTRLTISRMVSESVIKGTVNAVTQEGGQKTAHKDFEVAELRERLNPYQMGMDGNESSGSKVVQHELNSTEIGVSCCYADALEGQDKLVESLSSLINVTKEQFEKLEKEIGKVRDCGTSKRINPDSLELDTVLLEKVPKSWVDVDETLGFLRTTLDIVYKKVDAMVYLSKTSSNERQLKGDLREEIEDTVIKKSLQSAQEDIEVLGDKQASLYSNGSANWKEKIKGISNLRQELDAISKSFSVPETGQLSSHGSLEFGEDWNNSKWTDNFHRGVLGNRISPSVSLWEGNGKLEESIIAPENWDAANLKHMSREEMVNCFKMEMTKMKRNFECREELITDKYFSLRREYFKVQGSSLPSRKDKEFDMLRKKISEVILKLNDILVESEKIPTLSKDADSLIGLKERFDTLVFENHQLKDLLREKKRELKSLSLQLSDAEEKLSENLLAEEKWVKLIGDLKCENEDMHVQASICEEVYGCLLREVTGIIGSIVEDSEMEFHIIQEIYNVIFIQAAQNSYYAYKNETEDPVMESSIMQGLLEVVIIEVFKEANEKLNLSEIRYSEEKKIWLLLEMQRLETEKAIRLEIAEKERLKKEILLQAALLEEKEKLVLEAEARLAKENERFELTSQELINLREVANQQYIVTLEGRKVSDILKGDLVKALEKIESQKTEICDLNQKLEQIDEERKMFHGAVHKENALSPIEVKEWVHNKQVESTIALEQEFSKLVADFECRVTGAIKKNSLRFESMSSQFNDVIRKTVLARRTDLMFEQKLERRCSDLQKAESEVDLLADEVDVLLSLLEKIYIALDYYSPVLKHYPGIMEILKLVRKELSGGSARSV